MNYDFSKLEAFLAKQPHLGIPSIELAVAHHGNVAFRGSFGFSDEEGKRPASPSDLYWIFSASKVITCVAAMRLWEEGKIALCDPVSKYIPEFASLTVKEADGTLRPAQKTMTVEHLFTMTVGMTYDFGTPAIREAFEKTPTTLGIVRAMAKDPLFAEPGEHFRYSLCHDVLAAVVEVASGMRFSEYLEKNVFAPLGIKEMGFRPSEEQAARLAAMYTAVNGFPKAVSRTNYNNYAFTPDYDSGGAGLFASVDEYIKILTALSLGGTAKNGYRLLRPETVRMMGEGRLPESAQKDFFADRLYGYSWGLCGRAHVNPDFSNGRSAKG